MKILVDIRLLTSGRITGIEEYTIELLNRLLKLDTKNNYLFFYNALRKVRFPESWKSHPRTRIVEWSIPNKLFDLTNTLFDIPKLDGMFGPDLIFSPHFNIVSKNRGTPHIMTFHDIGFVHHPEFLSLRKRYYIWSQKYAEKARGASALIAVSEYTKWDLAETLKIPPEKITTIYPGINEAFAPIRKNSDILNKFRSSKKLLKPFILYLGTIEPRKNVNAVIRAFNILKTLPQCADFQLILAGELGWLYKNILKEAARSKYKNDIIFLGRVTSEDKLALYNLAEAFIYPSFFEGFGFPPLEAQACGTPVVAADRTSLPEILEGSAALVSPWKVEDMAFALHNIITDSTMRGSFVAKGFENIKRFSWTDTAQKTLALFENTAGK